MANQKLQAKNTLYAPYFVDSWEEQFLYPLADWINGMAFKEFYFTPKGMPVIKIAEIKNGISSQTKFTDGQYDEAYLLNNGDLLFCWSGQPQTSIDVFWWDGPEGWLNQHIFKVIPKTESRIFFFYLLKYLKPNFVQIAINKQTTGLGHVTKGDLERFVVKLPPPDEQRAIGAVLASLDDKIELLRAQNKTLENIVQALFKHWFIDFEFPDKDGKPYKSNGGKVVDSELGEIPESWKALPFSETIEIIGGGTPKTAVAEYWDGDIPWFSVIDAPYDSDVFVIDTDKKITNLGLENSSTKMLSEGTTIITARGTVGKVAMTGVPMTMNQSCYGLRGKDTGDIFTYYSTRNLVAMLKQHSHGAVFDTITRDTFSGVLIPVPPKSICYAFETAVSPLMSKIRSNLISIRTLSKIRDTLLPKLMKGEVRVKG